MDKTNITVTMPVTEYERLEAIKKVIGECKYRIKNIQSYAKSNKDADKKNCERNIHIIETTIQALEEIQAYRAIGTVEQLEWCKDASHWKSLYEEKLAKYEAIGTIEEFKALKEKAEPKKPILSKSMMTKREFQICPICERLVVYDGTKFDYCQYCGQKLDWS